MRIARARRLASIGVILVLAFGSLTLAGQQRGGPQPSLKGVWQLVELTTTGPNGSTNNKPQPAYWFITDKHYARLLVRGDKPRPELSATATATAEELRATWAAFTANAGPYEVTAETFTGRHSISNDSTRMRSGAFTTWSYKLDGTTLWATDRTRDTGNVTNPTTEKWIRVE
jgi:hypothetical protein